MKVLNFYLNQNSRIYLSQHTSSSKQISLSSVVNTAWTKEYSILSVFCKVYLLAKERKNSYNEHRDGERAVS